MLGVADCIAIDSSTHHGAVATTSSRVNFTAWQTPHTRIVHIILPLRCREQRRRIGPWPPPLPCSRTLPAGASRLCLLVIRWSSTSSSPTPSHGSRRCPWCFPKMVLASYPIVVRWDCTLASPSLALWAQFLSAFIMTGITEGRSGVGCLVRRMVLWRVGLSRYLVALTIVLTWVFNNTKGSVFIAVLVHATFDPYLATLNGLFPTPLVNDYGSNVPVLIGFGALAVVLVASTRGCLGYQRYRDEVPDPATAAT